MTEHIERLRCQQTVDTVQSLTIDREAFGRLVIEHETLLYNVGRTMLGNDADCYDAMQETVLAAWKGIGRLREARYFKTWLVRILINQCNALLRKKHFTDELRSDVPSYPADDEVLAVRRAVETLPAKLRPVVVLYYYEDFTTQEIAKAMGIPQGTVKSRLSTARNNLKKILE